MDPATRHWWQKVYFGAKPEYRDLGAFDVNQSQEAEPAAQRRRASVTANPVRQMLQDQASSFAKARSIMNQLIVEFGTPPSR